MGFRFRLTFHHSSPGFFRFEEQSIPVELAGGLDLILTARDADTLARAARFHIEGRGFPNEEAARSVGERLRLRLRALDSLLGLGLTIPIVDSRRDTLADAVKENELRETGRVIIDTIEGLAIISDDPNHVEHLVAGKVSVYPSDPAYVLKALAVMWPAEMQLDERADDVLQILSIATREPSPRARFLTTYLVSPLTKLDRNSGPGYAVGVPFCTEGDSLCVVVSRACCPLPLPTKTVCTQPLIGTGRKQLPDFTLTGEQPDSSTWGETRRTQSSWSS